LVERTTIMNRVVLGLFAFCGLVAVCAGQVKQCKEMHPVVLIPGIMGTVINANGDFSGNTDLPKECPNHLNDQLMWIDFLEVVNYKCLRYYFRSDYNPNTGKWEQIPGIDFIVPKWGSTYAVDVLAPGALTEKLIPYYRKMIKALEAIGYVDGENLLGGGYDWKSLPTNEWLGKMKDLIEGAVKKSNSKAIVVGHSMGGPYSYYFLKQMGDEWVSRYVYMYVPMAPAYMGAVKALDDMLEGFDHNVPIAGKYFAPLMRHIPSIYFLLPWKEAFKGMVLATTPSKTYTFDMLEDLLNAGNLSNVEGKMAATQGVFYNQYKNYDSFPKVPIRAFVGKGVDTVVQLKFKQDITPHDPDGSWESISSRINGDGDGTVPIQSLTYVLDKWKNSGADIQTFYYDNMEHLGIIKDATVINDFINLFCESD